MTHAHRGRCKPKLNDRKRISYFGHHRPGASGVGLIEMTRATLVPHCGNHSAPARALAPCPPGLSPTLWTAPPKTEEGYPLVGAGSATTSHPGNGSNGQPAPTELALISTSLSKPFPPQRTMKVMPGTSSVSGACGKAQGRWGACGVARTPELPSSLRVQGRRVYPAHILPDSPPRRKGFSAKFLAHSEMERRGRRGFP